MDVVVTVEPSFVVNLELCFDELRLTQHVRLDRHPYRSATDVLLMVVFALCERNKLLEYTRSDIYCLITTVLHLLILFGRAHRGWAITFV